MDKQSLDVSTDLQPKCGSTNFRTVFLATFVLALTGQSALAIPAFARRYNVPCHFCHDGFPKLSVIGEQFKERGLRLERERRDLRQWLKSVPVILRSLVNETIVEDRAASTTGFFKVVSAGNLNSRVSYWVDRFWVATEDGFIEDGGKTDNAWVRFELVSEELYVRGGRMELDLPFTQARTPNVFAYDIYFANTGFESDNIGSYQEGIEVGGFLDDVTRWSLALVRGRNSGAAESLTDQADDFDGNLFGRFARRFGENRAGAFVYVGRNTLARHNPQPGLDGPPVLVWKDDLFRFGADGSLVLERLNLYGVVMHGRNDNSIADARHPEGTEETLTFTGGFLQGDYMIRDQLTFSARLNVVSRPPGTAARARESLVSFFPGLKIWLHPRVRLTFELGFQNQGRPTVGAVQAEVAF
ncbi:MAG: hypothetical protein ACE5JI_00570 [Acidobacteriota bacterium]